MTTVYKKLQILLLIIILALKLAPEARANNAFVSDNRFTAAAHASDYSQCASLIAIYIATKIAVKIACDSGCAYTATAMAANPFTAAAAPGFLTGCLASCPFISDAAAFAALWAAYEAYSAWADDIRENTKVVNTIDPDRPQCGNTSNLDDSSNFAHDDGQTYRGWDKTGPMSNYCYHQDWNHNLKVNENIYNNGEGKIGISYDGNTPVWIKSEDCDTIATNAFESIIGGERVFCAWTEGDEICAEAVFCTSLGIGDIAPIYGFVGDPTRLSYESRRACGDDPYSDSTIDDFQQNKRCECFCCDGSTNFEVCDSLPPGRACKTYNERYYAHCIKRAVPDEAFDAPIVPPRTLSAHCSLDMNSGYKDFSFMGKAVRCFEKTISNIYFGKEDIYQYNLDGSKAVDVVTGNPVFTTRCIDDQEDSRGCTKAMYRIIQERIANLVMIVLTFWAFLLGVQFTMGKAGSRGDMLVHFLKFGIVIYFVTGDAWRDGYYDFLMHGAYELSADFFQVTTDGAADTAILDLVDPLDVNLSDEDAAALASCSFNDLPIASDEAWDKIQECNFFDGMDSYGMPYPVDENYLAVLDSLDCKFASYIGFDRNGYFPEIIKVATAVLFDTASGFFFFIAAMVFLYVSILIMLKVSFMLVVAVIMINFMIYVSPIMIPLIMIKRTKPIFDKWLATVLGFSLQPFLILVLLSLIMLLMDAFFVIYLQGLYDLGVEYKPGFLGISLPSIAGNYDDSALISNMLKFMFLLVIVMHMFDKFDKVLSQLSGADSVSSFVKTPDFHGTAKKGAKFAKKQGENAARYGTSKARKGINKGVDAIKKNAGGVKDGAKGVGKAAASGAKNAASSIKGAASSAMNKLRGKSGEDKGSDDKAQDKGGSGDSSSSSSGRGGVETPSGGSSGGDSGGSSSGGSGSGGTPPSGGGSGGSAPSGGDSGGGDA